MVFCISGHFYHPFFFLLRKKAPRHHADVPGGFAIWRKQGDAVRPARGKSVDQLVMSCAVDGELSLAAVVGKHKGGNVGTHGQHLVDDKAGLPAPGAEHHHTRHPVP